MKEPSQSMKYANSVVPIAADNATLTFVELDTKGWDRLQVILSMGATDIALTACKLTEADVTATSHAVWTGSDFDGDTEVDGTTAALPTALQDELLFIWDINLKNRMRFIDAVITVGDGTSGGVFSVLSILSRGSESPVGVSERGATGYLRS